MKSCMLGFYAVLLLWLLVLFSIQDARGTESSCSSSYLDEKNKELQSVSNRTCISFNNDDGRPVDCCTAVSDIKIDPKNIVEYCIQESVLCPVRAVRFQTKKNKVICSDPDSKYAKNVMRIVNRRKTTTKPSQKPTMCNRKIMNPPVTTKKAPGTETETNTSTTVPPKVMTIKTSGPETSTSTTVTPTVSTIKKYGPETSTRTTVTQALTTIKKSGPETSTSTTVTPAVTTIKKSGPETSTSTTLVSTDNPESTVTTCETTTTTTQNQRTKPSKLKLKKLSKSKKRLKTFSKKIQ